MKAGEGRDARRLTPDDVRVAAVVLGAASVLVGIVAWGINDADRDARAQRVAATRAPQVVDVGAGRHSATSEEEFAAYYPPAVRAHPGDIIRFTNPTIEDPHSVTFGLRRDRSNQPRFGRGDSLPNLNRPCVSDVPLTRLTTVCDGIEDLAPAPSFSGQPFFNSGIIPPGGGVFELRLADTLAAGTYEFACVIHPAQVGTLEVVASDSPTQRPRDLHTAADARFDEDVRQLRAVRRQVQTLADMADRSGVRAGAATERVSLNAFLPRRITVDAGQSVTWTNTGSVPHVMIFGGFLAPPEAITAPPTRRSGFPLSAGLFTTGPIGAPPYPSTTFTIRFDVPGSYSYVCTFHPGMAGTVNVR